GRVLIWDTESWAANTEETIAAMVAGCASFGYDRIVGTYGGGTLNQLEARIPTENGDSVRVTVPHAWPINAAIAASQAFLGERPFRELLFRNGLPWGMVFDGLPGAGGTPNPEDGTVVVVGELARVFPGALEKFPFRTVRCLAEVAHETELRDRLAALPADAPTEQRAELRQAIDDGEPFAGATLTLPDADGAFRLFGTYGNRIPAENGNLVLPLTKQGWYLRTDGSPGSFARLLEALRRARIEGLEPLATVCRDMTDPVPAGPTLNLELTNILNRPLSGTLTLTLGNLRIEAPTSLTLAPHQTRTVPIRIVGGQPSPDNTYPLALVFDAGPDGKAVHHEDMHVNRISRRTVTVDGDLADWQGTLPQPIRLTAQTGATLEEVAWFPYRKLPASLSSGFATAYMAHDDAFFYFAARIADETPDDGTVRFDNRDDNAYYYPPVSIEFDQGASLMATEAVADTADPADTGLLQHPTDEGKRVNGQWQYEMPSTAFGIDVSIPGGQPCQVAFFIPPWHSHGMTFEVYDRKTGRRLGRETADGARNYHGLYLKCNAEGDLRFRVSGPAWRRVSVAGIFLDPPVMDDRGRPVKTGKVLPIDYDTSGNWRGTYGRQGFHVIGTDPRLPDGVTVTVPRVVARKEHVWPEGVRRYSYRRHPELPSGTNTDNVQIAFNAIPAGDPDSICGPWESLAFPPGTRPGYTNYDCTDYEYALNRVAPEYGGSPAGALAMDAGTEIFRLRAPGLPRKHFYPRQPRHPLEGAVRDGRLASRRDGNTRIVECAIPWSEIPHVKALRDAAKPVKFTCRVNDQAGKGCMELARGRSVAKRGYAFHVDWEEHWTNEVEFGWE
ncbi:MAG: hypothetical protein JXR77_18410, partial [Lentisphaeria bacterium]|nr:hypothetical protein [Lentisphaeria bacterium]